MSGIISDNVGRGSGLVKAAAAGGGAWNFLNKQTASTSSLLEWNSQITSTYDVYKLFCSNCHSSVDSAQITMQFRQSGSYLTGSDYRYVAAQARDNSSPPDCVGSTGTSEMRLTRDATGNGAGRTWNFEITFWDLLGTDNYKQIHWNAANINQDGNTRQDFGSGAFMDSVAAMDGFKIFMSGGTIVSGEFSLFGLAQS